MIAGADSRPDDRSGALVLEVARAAVKYGWINLPTTMVSSFQTRSHVRLSSAMQAHGPKSGNVLNGLLEVLSPTLNIFGTEILRSQHQQNERRLQS